MGLLLNRAKANTATTGTGTVTLGGAVVPYQTFAAAGAVNAQYYDYLIEDGNAWELGTGLYNSSAGTITRPGPSADQNFASSSGALLNLSGSATIACVANVNRFGPTLLQTQTVSGAASVIFDNTKICAPFSRFDLEYVNVNGSTAGIALVGIQLSPDNGVTWRTTGYVSSQENWGVSTNFSAYSQNTSTTAIELIASIENDAALPAYGECAIYGILDATKKTIAHSKSISKLNDGNIYEQKTAGYYNTAAEAHNAIKIVPSAGTISGTFRLFGRL